MFKHKMGSNKNIVCFEGWRENWKVYVPLGSVNITKYSGVVRIVKPEELKKNNDRRVLSQYKNKVFVYVDYITNHSVVLECLTIEEAIALRDYVKEVLG